MAVKVKLGPTNDGFFKKLFRFCLVAFLFCVVIGAVAFGIDYHHYQGIVDARLAQGPLFASEQIYAAPQEVRPGQQLTASNIASALRRAGYNQNPQLGTFELRGNAILIKPGPESYLAPDGATITTNPAGVVQSITAENGVSLAAYKLEPELITALSEDKNRIKRRIVTYDQIPPRMVQAVTSIEDRRFFEHGGINYVRTFECAVHDIMVGRKDCGGSTLTQQLAKNFFLTPDKSISRKISEVMITYQLEAHFNKQQIFTMYANEINIGQRGTYGINGFGEAAQAYFGTNLRQLNTAQCALIAGLIQNPSRRNPYRHPARAMERRNVVLDSMVETGDITKDEADEAKAEPLNLAPLNIDGSEAPYFVDLVHDQLVERLGDEDLTRDNLRIYTSLDPALQEAASYAVTLGIRHVDDLVRKLYERHHRRGYDGHINYPQVALVALNPHTGQILALVGGRNYDASQLDHALAERPTGSIFKPIVYATAFNTSLNGTPIGPNGGVFTALTKLNDDPQNFGTSGRPYMPGNFVHGEFPGMVTASTALEHSLNIATIALAQMVGYDNVASLAHAAGIVNARATPSVAIGTYDATPIDMAGVYTIFANNGVHIKPWVLDSVRNPQGDVVADFAPEARQVLDPRIAYLVESMLEGVMARGTGSVVRSMGFTAPAAGKTGTSHDAWFAGYSSNLLCIIWVGNDDYSNVNLQGADAAAPIWADFMNRAIKLPQYSDMKPFSQPNGVVTLQIDKATDLPVDASCPSDSFSAAFLDGTQPQGTCSQMGPNLQAIGQAIDGNAPHRNIFQKIFGLNKNAPQQPQTPPQPSPSPQ